MVERENTLEGRTIYIPRMGEGSSRVFAAAFNAIGVQAAPSPEGDERTKELAARYTSGDECYPERVTLGNFLKVLDRDDFDPAKVGFFMPTATGPCRFGQYAPFLRRALKKIGHEDVLVLSPSSATSYRELGDNVAFFRKLGWWSLLSADALRRMLHKRRPYEKVKGDTDRVYEQCLVDLCNTIGEQDVSEKVKMTRIIESLTRSVKRFQQIDADFSKPRLLIGVVGEIFCRLNTFSNESIIRKIEEYGGEAWLSDIAEWAWYTLAEVKKNLRLRGQMFSKNMLKASIAWHVQRRDEHKLLQPFKEEFVGYEEPHDVHDVLELSDQYLPYTGALGEMVLSVGKAIYLYEKGADGIVDISPFTCMNGIVCESVYPKVSKNNGAIPIRTFYFDGTAVDLDNDVGIFMELAANYHRTKKIPRILPSYFKSAA
jgi:predicted nucleotide-binding protein (sugar kinase/HSP70/actin superfamily)